MQLHHIDEQLRIIEVNARHGREASLKKDGMFIDLFQHIEDEAKRTRKWLAEAISEYKSTQHHH